VSQTPRVHVVILNWNGWRDTLECLESLFRQSYDNYQVVVCDNDSQDGSIEKIQSWANGDLPAPDVSGSPLARLSQPAIRKPLQTVLLDRHAAESCGPEYENVPLVLIRTGGNLGFAGGNNVGLRFVLRQSSGDFVWVLNNDTVVEPDALTHMVQHSLTLAQSGTPNTCGSLVCFYDDPKVIQALGGSRFNRWTGIASQTLGRFLPLDSTIDHGSVQSQLDYITGCSWLLPLDFLKTVGLMEERYFLYYEEIDWTLRSGGRYVNTYSPQALVYHKEGSSIGSKTLKRGASMLSEFYMARNKFRVAAKFFPVSLPVVFVFTMLQAANRLRQREPKKAWQLFKVALGKQNYP